VATFIDDIVNRYVFTNWTARSILFVESPYLKGVEKTGQVFMSSIDELMPLIEKSWRGYGSIRFSIHPRFQGINNVWYLERLMWDFDVGAESQVNPRLIINVALTFARHLSSLCDTKPLIVFSGMKGAHVVAFLSPEVGDLTQDKPQDVLEYVHSSLYNEITSTLRKLVPGINGVLEDSGANYKVLTKLPYTRHEKSLSETHFVSQDGFYIPPIDAVKVINEAMEKPITECSLGNATVNITDLVKEYLESYKYVKKEIEEKTAKAVEVAVRSGGRKNRFAEMLLEKPPNDCKKRLIIAVLAPYLVNEKGLGDDEAINILHKWCVEGGGKDRECMTVARNAVKQVRKKQLLPPHNPLNLLDKNKGWNKAFNFNECADLLKGIAMMLGKAQEKGTEGVGG